MTAEGDLVLDGPGAATTFVCAGYDYAHDIAQTLLSLLPAVLHVPADPIAGARIKLGGQRFAKCSGESVFEAGGDVNEIDRFAAVAQMPIRESGEHHTVHSAAEQNADARVLAGRSLCDALHTRANRLR